jgi:hypothetical protein
MGKSYSDRAFVAVPGSLDGVLDPVWLQWALDDVADDDRIVSVEQTGTSKTLAQKSRFVVAIDDPNGQRRTRHYCVKAHFDEEGPGTLGGEARFYRDLAPRVGVRTPRAYYTGLDESGRALIVMDDVVADGGRFLDAREPYSIEVTRDSLSQLARLHSSTWGDPKPAGCDWLAPTVPTFAQLYGTERLDLLLNDGRAEGAAAELRDAVSLRSAVALTALAPATCVLHGDTHSGNVYLDAQGRACWLDWQIAQPGNWSTDVSYHLATVLSIDDRRAHEQELLRHYLDELDSYGVEAPAWHDAWERYTLGFAFGYFLWVITTISSREVVMHHIPRLAAALTDHDTYRRLGVETTSR